MTKIYPRREGVEERERPRGFMRQIGIRVLLEFLEVCFIDHFYFVWPET